MPEDKGLTVTVTWPDEPPVEPVNVFRVTRIGRDVQVLLGYINLAVLADAAEKGKAGVELKPIAPRALSMGAVAFQRLYRQVKEIYDAMTKSGDLPLLED